MKAVLFDPYLDTLGGGERYFLTLASYLTDMNWQVDILWPDMNTIKKAQQIFAIDTERVKILDINPNEIKLLKKIEIMRKYDLSFFISDGSIPFLFAKKNFLHFQVPFHNIRRNKLAELIKFKFINEIISNSYFTKLFIDKQYSIKSQVIYPPVTVDKLSPGKKSNIILSVGRFTDLLHNKRQDVLINIFIRLIASRKDSWKLVLAGNDKEGKKFVENLKKASLGYPIEVLTNVSFTQISELYRRAKIFWSATGYGIDEGKSPEQVEHFGITTVEAMAAGCVPIVVGKGGQKEIIDSGRNGFLWNNIDEAQTFTRQLIEDEILWQKLSQNAVYESQKFSKDRFCKSYEKIIEKISRT
ncbi:MAG TPA: glycosyltransferase family 4 protein [Candidatus Bathyarchaeia archaeon]|nr:glycosyltransferase family 4 protein [Candidatus Bathyarchaeia archaeon]